MVTRTQRSSHDRKPRMGSPGRVTGLSRLASIWMAIHIDPANMSTATKTVAIATPKGATAAPSLKAPGINPTVPTTAT
jgi:hypothetical protein